MPETPTARPASTVVLLRDSARGLETLLLRRNKALVFAGGLWVFPGGALDADDLAAAAGDVPAASRLAAAREAFEESGQQPRLEDMVQLSHWTTPAAEPKRFSTYFFAAPVSAHAEVVIDGGEIHDSLWIAVRHALQIHERGELGMLPPTYIHLLALSRYDSVAQLLTVERDSISPEVFPVLSKESGRMCVMFRGDAGYDSADAATPGARHRAVLDGKRWRYVYRDVDNAWPPLAPVVAAGQAIASAWQPADPS